MRPFVVASLALICVFAFCGTASAQFGGPDTDGDGFDDVIDQCDHQPGTQAFLGCPSDDSDGDGIGISQNDQCPGEAGPAPGGCPPAPPPEPEPEANNVSAARMVLESRGGRLSLYGQPFRPTPAGLFTPRTLTVWLPKGISLLVGGKVKTCSKAQARGLTLDTDSAVLHSPLEG
jgi:hypothetical protein